MVSKSELDSLLASEDVVFLQFAQDNSMQETYRQVAARLQDVLVFAVAKDKALRQRYKIADDDDATLVLKDGKVIVFSEEYTVVCEFVCCPGGSETCLAGCAV